MYIRIGSSPVLILTGLDTLSLDRPLVRLMARETIINDSHLVREESMIKSELLIIVSDISNLNH